MSIRSNVMLLMCAMNTELGESLRLQQLYNTLIEGDLYRYIYTGIYGWYRILVVTYLCFTV